MGKFDANLYFPREMPPLLCTRVKGTIAANDRKAFLCSPRNWSLLRVLSAILAKMQRAMSNSA